MSARPTVLLVDDEPFILESLTEIMEAEGYEVRTAADAAEAIDVLSSGPVSVAVTDLRMPGLDGLALLRHARAAYPAVPVILMTGAGRVSDAVEAMKAGAYDFLQKPVAPDDLLRLVGHARERHALQEEVRTLRGAVRSLAGPSRLVGSSPAMSRVRDLIAQVAPTDAFVLITGESGTGKELAAAAIHDASARADRPLVRVNCAAIPESLFESEFFGHRRGAFSGAIADRTGRFAEADGGTLVLDEIGTLGLDMQAKLLRVLESGEYQVVGESRTRVADVRLIAVTNENMDARVKEGTFRSDLFYRINIFPITVPPLREHASDLPELVTHVLGRLASRRGGPSDAVSRLSPDALASLRAYRWPGNVRELRNVLERALIVSGPGAPTAATFAGILEAPMRAGDAIGQDAFHLRRNLDDHERQLILAALEETGGRKKEAAGLLGVDPRNLGYYLRKHGLQDGGTG